MLREPSIRRDSYKRWIRFWNESESCLAKFESFGDVVVRWNSSYMSSAIFIKFNINISISIYV